MPYGYIDPVQRVHQQQALRNLAQPQHTQPTVQQLQPVQSPLQLGNVPEILYGNGNTTPRHRDVAASAAAGALIGAAVGILVHRNWHRAWVRGVVSGLGAFLVTWIVTFTGACIASAYIKPGDQADLGPILGWTALSSVAVAVLAACAGIRRRPGSRTG